MVHQYLLKGRARKQFNFGNKCPGGTIFGRRILKYKFALVITERYGKLKFGTEITIGMFRKNLALEVSAIEAPNYGEEIDQCIYLL